VPAPPLSPSRPLRAPLSPLPSPAPAPAAQSYGSGIGAHLAKLAPGDTVSFKGPLQKFAYQPNTWAAVGMLAGGTGVTPMVQLVRAILSDPRDRTEVRLILANKTRGDIMLKEELDALAAAHPQFSVVYTLDSPDEGWQVRSRCARRWRAGARAAPPPPPPLLRCSPHLHPPPSRARRTAPPLQGERGFISEEMIRASLPPPADGAPAHRIFVCGPPPMMKALSGEKKSPADQGELSGLLAQLGYSASQVYKY
jgi:cytochrome-b5 reductase